MQAIVVAGLSPESPRTRRMQITPEPCSPIKPHPINVRCPKIQNTILHAGISNRSLHETQKSQPHHNIPDITPSASPCLSSSVACHPSFVHRFHLAWLLLLSLRRRRTDPSLASSTRAAFRTESCFLHSDLVASAQAVASLAVFACLYAGCGGRAGKQARQGPRIRRPRWRIRTKCRGSAWSVREC